VSEQQSARRVVAVVLGAGQGTRMGRPINKIFLPLDGKPVILHAIESFEQCAQVDEIVLVAASGEAEQLAELARNAHCDKVKCVIAGGATRHASERCALEALRTRIEAGEIDIMLIHDGARPFVSLEKVTQLIQQARNVGGAILALPLQEGERIVQVDDERVARKSYEGGAIWRAQTPQAFQAVLLLSAYDAAERKQFYGTDTAASVELMGYPVAVVESDETNLKITTAHDLLHAEKLSRYRRFRSDHFSMSEGDS
jgi:2-C-methyl-D-erythritol 4-phosphate cytidylyltransferase